jgi:hypothetical protein
LPDGQLIGRARSELADIFPWLDFSAADWATCTVNRAEPKQDKLIKPDNAFAETSEEMANVIIGWPTKLTLAPDMAQRVLNQLQQQIKPIAPRGLDLLDSLPKPAIAIPPWDQVW